MKYEIKATISYSHHTNLYNLKWYIDAKRTLGLYSALEGSQFCRPQQIYM